MTNPIHGAYTAVKAAVATDCKAASTGDQILDLVMCSMNFLSKNCALVNLTSKVPGKNYVTYEREGKLARPANVDLLITSQILVAKLWKRHAANPVSLTAPDFAKLCYTVALMPCLAMEIFDRQNKKGPATYFECLVGHLFAKELGVNPDRSTRLPIEVDDKGNAKTEVRMTMDFLFDLGTKRGKIHLPVKMSTRERVVQAWAHHRLLEAAFGEGAYAGVMVLFSETKLDIKKREVVEICVPDQWLAYQFLLAKMERIYYFDMPERYRALSASHPSKIVIKDLGEFFKERAVIFP